MTLWIVVPAFNEAESLPQVLPDIAQAATAIDPGARVLVVDDGSTDGTPQIVEQIREERPEVLLISLGGNKGKAAALKRGLGLAVESGARDISSDETESTVAASSRRTRSWLAAVPASARTSMTTSSASSADSGESAISIVVRAPRRTSTFSTRVGS